MTVVITISLSHSVRLAVCYCLGRIVGGDDGKVRCGEGSKSRPS